MNMRLTGLLCALNLLAACVRETPAATDTIDVFTHQRAQVDVLLVVDDSRSMVDDRADLADSYPELVELFGNSGVDWHLGVISTDATAATSGGRLTQAGPYRWLDESTPHPSDVFAELLQSDETASASERARSVIHDAITVHDAAFNAGFLRADAQLAVLVVSDEDDQTASPTVGDFVPWFEQLRQVADDATLHAMVGLPDQSCGSVAGIKHIDVAERTGGLIFDLCERDFVGAAAQITDTWSSSPFYFLSEQPQAELEVLVTEPYAEQRALDAEAWAYNAQLNAVRITPSYRPPVGTVFEVRYAPAAP